MFVRHFIVMVLSCFALPVSHAAETVAMLDFEPWVIGTEVHAQQGLMVELSDRLFAGESVVKQQVPTRRLMIEAKSGAFDWLFHGCHIPFTQHEVIGRLLHFEQGLLILATSPVKQIEDLRGQSVAVWSSRLGALPKLEQDSLITKIEINDISNGIRMVNENRVAALAVGSLVVGWQLNRIGLDPMKFRYLTTETVEGCLYANRSVPTARRDLVRQRLNSLLAEGFIDALVQRYGGASIPRRQ